MTERKQADEQLRRRFGIGAVDTPPRASLADEQFSLETLFEAPSNVARARVAASRYRNQSARDALAELADLQAALADDGGDAA